jgi:STAM-binding protein
MRFAILIIEKLPQHPEAKEPKNRAVIKAATSNALKVLARLEILKPSIEANVKAYEKRQLARAAAHDFDRTEHHRTPSAFARTDPAIAGNTNTLAAAEHGDLAVKLAHKEIRRRDAARKATRQAGISEEEEQERRTAGLWDDWEAELSKNKHTPPDDFQASMEDSRRRLDGSNDSLSSRRRLSKADRRTSRTLPISTSSDYRYPSVQRPSSIAYDSQSSALATPPSEPNRPPKPPKEDFDDEWTLPIRPSKEPLSAVESKHSSVSTTDDVASKHTFRPSAYLENGQPLRTVFLPPTLREEFLKYAAVNTRANLETCGILCGTLISNALFISRLVIPEQTSTSDTCETVNESALFDYCDSEDLMVLGWIHTHPSQTCFMSSRDLHTHCGYQVMMPEAIAIVCAPSKQPS